MSVTYRSSTGRVTERVRVELTPAEARAFTEAWEHLEPMLGDADEWPIATGLRRIATDFRLETEPIRAGTGEENGR